MDVVSVIHLRKMRKRIADTLSANKNQQRYKKEVLMTIQTFVNTILCYLMLCGYHVFSNWIQLSPILTFLSTNFLWCLVVASGGYSAVLFNADVRRVALHPLKLISRGVRPNSPNTSATPHIRAWSHK
ncbi:unnamed protein product [Nippostrongylus brasiliensis]|uniref:7TM_GPCR_Srx domain-containing protein n=1 Tax=Nippostrongylus brasiliensis TaxID=27835 RepID=A0A0N4XWK5_NIPBR|nr:unnamed protein product [Nippostrongylus brasiliensis]